jgi:hypothetical protein
VLLVPEPAILVGVDPAGGVEVLEAFKVLWVGVAVAEPWLGVGSGFLVGVGLGVPVGVGVGLGVRVGVAVGLGVRVGVAVGLGVRVGVAVGARVGLGLGLAAGSIVRSGPRT